MEDFKIKRINELAKKAKTPGGLTEDETKEREALRREYIDSMKKSLRAQLDNIDVEYPGGNVMPLKRKQK